MRYVLLVFSLSTFSYLVVDAAAVRTVAKEFSKFHKKRCPVGTLLSGLRRRASSSQQIKPATSFVPSSHLLWSSSPIMSKFKPRSYEALTPLQKKLYSPSYYQQLMYALNVAERRGIGIYKLTKTIDGQPSSCLVLFPKDNGLSKRKPGVYNLSGGYNGTGSLEEWGTIDLAWIVDHLIFLAEHGYVVFAPYYRGADGNENKDEFGGKDVDDVEEFFCLFKDSGEVDYHDISLHAFSRGTVMLKCLLERLQYRDPALCGSIKSAIIKGGISDLVTYEKLPEWNKFMEPIFKQARPGYFDESPLEQKKILESLSLAYSPELLTGISTCIFHAETDSVVPSILSKNLYESLKKKNAGGSCDFGLWKEKNHYILGHNEQVQASVIKWMQKCGE